MIYNNLCSYIFSDVPLAHAEEDDASNLSPDALSESLVCIWGQSVKDHNEQIWKAGGDSEIWSQTWKPNLDTFAQSMQTQTLKPNFLEINTNLF